MRIRRRRMKEYKAKLADNLVNVVGEAIDP